MSRKSSNQDRIAVTRSLIESAPITVAVTIVIELKRSIMSQARHRSVQTPLVAILTRESPDTGNDGIGQRVVRALGVQYLNDAGVIPHYELHPVVFDAKAVSRHSTQKSIVLTTSYGLLL